MRRLILVFCIALVALIGGSVVAYAQAAPKPSISRVDVDAVVQADRSAKVTAKYAINNAEGLKDLKVVSQFADLPGLTIEGLSATAGSTTLQVSNEKKPGFDLVTIQLPADAKGKVEYTLEYTAKCTASDFRLPVMVPTFPVAASVPSFFATVTLPPNVNFQGDEFPRLASIGQQGASTVVKMQEVNLPTFIMVNFGPGGAPLFSETNVTTLA
jgi:hypothetical protein